jgi:membrane protein implicated in regulation of membrane protease activity
VYFSYLLAVALYVAFVLLPPLHLVTFSLIIPSVGVFWFCLRLAALVPLSCVSVCSTVFYRKQVPSIAGVTRSARVSVEYRWIVHGILRNNRSQGSLSVLFVHP